MYFPIDEDLQIAGYDSLEAVAKTEDSPLDIYRHALLFLPTAQAAEAFLSGSKGGVISYTCGSGWDINRIRAFYGR